MPETVDTVVIGAGQAGLCASYELRRRGRDHLVLEKGRVAERWRSQRWDSFTLVTPNWTLRLPDHPYDRDPDGFLPRDAVVRYLESFAEDVDPPLRTGVEVRRVGAGRAAHASVWTRPTGRWRPIRSWWPSARSSVPGFRPERTGCRIRSARCRPPTTAVPRRCPRARSWWSAAASRARRSHAS